MPEMQKSRHQKTPAFFNLAPLTGIVLANGWLIIKLSGNGLSVETARMTTNNYGLYKSGLSDLRLVVFVTIVFPEEEA
ncbi:hypothetical protein [Ewingella americana]|uniref:hypothetical protein n=1 Tax=Ewingella americana TaxID=41202 RepID=UPI0013874C9F|nr:hypothetical protein [Ewingella americana]